ncbi:MAG: Type 1 glutamine amidotransferase-like domain-containing protein [Chloroflexi bacterium]|nr:Type 1 glutamine amidotransferase-like domain-containing protein [Chloroflexota bacterium]
MRSPRPKYLPRRPLFIPMGAGYRDTIHGFLQGVLQKDRDRHIKILLLAMTYSTNADSISAEERAQNLLDAEKRRQKVEEECAAIVPGNYYEVTVAPIFTRADALDPDHLHYFTADLSAIFFLGGDQTVAMQVIANTPIERALADAYARGVPICGTSAGSSLLCRVMMGGYNDPYNRDSALVPQAVSVWNTAEQRGLDFGIPNAILDQHFFQRSRMARLLNAIIRPDVPHVGIGLDAYTGLFVRDGALLDNVFGLYTVTVLDGETFNSMHSAGFRGTGGTLSVRNVLVHLLAPGKFSYDLRQRRHSLAAAPRRLKRAFPALTLPREAGILILGGNLRDPHSPHTYAILRRFLREAGQHVLIVAAGFESEEAARLPVDPFVDFFNSQKLTVRVFGDETQLPETDYDSIIFIGANQALLHPEVFATIKQKWQRGMPLLADNAAAALLGSYYAAHGPTPDDEHAAENDVQGSFKQGATSIKPGLGLLPLLIEPRVMGNNRWGRLFSLAYNHPDTLALGLADNTAVIIDQQGARALGENAVFVLDLRQSRRALGSSGLFVIANGLLDVFAGGEALTPEDAYAHP